MDNYNHDPETLQEFMDCLDMVTATSETGRIGAVVGDDYAEAYGLLEDAADYIGDYDSLGWLKMSPGGCMLFIEASMFPVRKKGGRIRIITNESRISEGFDTNKIVASFPRTEAPTC